MDTDADTDTDTNIDTNAGTRTRSYVTRATKICEKGSTHSYPVL